MWIYRTCITNQQNIIYFETVEVKVKIYFKQQKKNKRKEKKSREKRTSEVEKRREISNEYSSMLLEKLYICSSPTGEGILISIKGVV